VSDLYDDIGIDYSLLRKPDPRWIARINQAAGIGPKLVNIGAGAGSYEPVQMDVIAVEPSMVMIRQRPAEAAPVVCAAAENLPFGDKTFDVALAILTTHHWQDPEFGLAEMQRVARRQVVVTWDPTEFESAFWLVRDYLPEAVAREEGLATLSHVIRALPDARVETLAVPEDCTDGFFGAYWKRPRAYLDERVRGAISGLALLDATVVEGAISRLRDDIDSGRWDAQYADILNKVEMDLGYRIVINE
jgi:SAM-dependent methyltransferase